MRRCLKVTLLSLLVVLSILTTTFALLHFTGPSTQAETGLPGAVGDLPYYGIPQIIEVGLAGTKSDGTGAPGEPFQVVWDSIHATVPAEKKWIIIVGPTDQFAHVGEVRQSWRGYDFSLMGVFKEGDNIYHGELPAGEYQALDLYIYNTMQIFAEDPAEDGWAQTPVLYLVLQVDAL